MAAEHGRAARRNGAHGATLRAAQRVGAPIRRAMGADDVGELDPAGPRHADARGGGRRQGHASGAGRLGQIQRRAGGEDAPRREVQIACGGREVAVAEQSLHRRQVASSLEQVGGEGVPERGDATLLGDARAELRQLESFWATVMSIGRVPCRLGKSQTCGGRMRQYARQSWSSRWESGT
jgi:hypothetical protein